MSSSTLTIDVSTGGIHICIVDKRMQIIHKEYKEFEYLTSEIPGAKEIDTDTLWALLIQMMRSLRFRPDLTAGISEIAVTSQREGCVFLDREDRVLSACPNIDSRASKIARSLPRSTKEEIYDITGHWPDCYFPAMRLLWFKHEAPSTYTKISRFMMLNEWIVYKLLGKNKDESVSEETNASESMLFDVRKRTWSHQIIELLELSHLRLAKIEKPGTIVGSVSSSLAREIGISESVDVKISMADTQSAVLGSGGFEPGDIVIVNGSTTPVQLVTDSPILDNRRRTWTCPYLPDLWTLESNCRKTGLMFRKIKNDLQELLSQFDDSLSLTSEQLDKIISINADRSFDTMAFLGPGIFDVSQGKDLPISLSFYDERVNIFSAILIGYIENLTFAIKANIEQLKEISNISLRRIILTGGASRNSLLRVILPRILRENELLITDNLDTTSLGASIIGREKDSEIEKALLNSLSRLSSNEDMVGDFYNKKFEMWKQWYSKMISIT